VDASGWVVADTANGEHIRCPASKLYRAPAEGLAVGPSGRLIKPDYVAAEELIRDFYSAKHPVTLRWLNRSSAIALCQAATPGAGCSRAKPRGQHEQQPRCRCGVSRRRHRLARDLTAFLWWMVSMEGSAGPDRPDEAAWRMWRALEILLVEPRWLAYALSVLMLGAAALGTALLAVGMATLGGNARAPKWAAVAAVSGIIFCLIGSSSIGRS
jgi:hypothetical protein